jgi:hypothetical protein
VSRVVLRACRRVHALRPVSILDELAIVRDCLLDRRSTEVSLLLDSNKLMHRACFCLYVVWKMDEEIVQW